MLRGMATGSSFSLHTRHSIETERQRENLLNAERTRREKWMQEQSKKIKVSESTSHTALVDTTPQLSISPPRLLQYIRIWWPFLPSLLVFHHPPAGGDCKGSGA